MKKMPERHPSDGAVGVSRDGENSEIVITCVTNGRPYTLRTSEYNAWRVFGALSLFLEIPLPPKVGKAIKPLGENKS